MRAQNAGLASALDTMPWGIVIINADGRVVRANAVATALAAKSDGLALHGNKLEASSSSATQALRKLIREACRASCGRGGEPAGSLTLTRPSDGSRLMIFVAPLSEASGIALGGAAPGAIVFIADPATRRLAPTQAIAQAFGLTPAEVRLAVALASGDTVQEIAERHGLSKNTVRVQLQSVFAKTRTRRQAELATLVLSLPSLTVEAP
jgi:DNA-binding CsgD family transcriptional regulator